MLVLNHLLFFFEIPDNLLQTLLQDLNLLLVLFGSALLQLLSSHILLFCATVDVYVTFKVFIHFFQIRNLSFVVVD